MFGSAAQKTNAKGIKALFRLRAEILELLPWGEFHGNLVMGFPWGVGGGWGSHVAIVQLHMLFWQEGSFEPHHFTQKKQKKNRPTYCCILLGWNFEPWKLAAIFSNGPSTKRNKRKTSGTFEVCTCSLAELFRVEMTYLWTKTCEPFVHKTAARVWRYLPYQTCPEHSLTQHTLNTGWSAKLSRVIVSRNKQTTNTNTDKGWNNTSRNSSGLGKTYQSENKATSWDGRVTR